jgi:hypothetical protein
MLRGLAESWLEDSFLLRGNTFLKEVKAEVGNLKAIVMDARPLKDFKPKAAVGAHDVAGRVLRLSVWESPLEPNEQRQRFLKNNALAEVEHVACE